MDHTTVGFAIELVVGFVNTGSVTSLIIGAAVLAVIAVLLDRLNFPQKPFRAKQIETRRQRGPTRDRTGAHIVDVHSDDAD
ncbi:MAG: hypothetical protein OER95_14545 [Acidimicrobiia bacterium]|nr:hypothetical protein [Acidimicrobiia bacterium]